MIMGGSGLTTMGDIAQGETTNNMLKYNANVQIQNAANARAAAALNANKQSIMAQKTLGAIQANYGASGVEGTSGSVMDVMAASASNAELDRQNILYGGEIKAINSENQASMDRFEGSQAVSAGYLNAVASMATAGGQLLSSNYGSNPSKNPNGLTDEENQAAMEQGTEDVYGDGTAESTTMEATGGEVDAGLEAIA